MRVKFCRASVKSAAIQLSVAISMALVLCAAMPAKVLADGGGFAEITCKNGRKSVECPAGKAADCYCDTSNTAQCGACRKVPGASADHPHAGAKVSITCKIGSATKSCPSPTKADCYCDSTNQAACRSCR